MTMSNLKSDLELYNGALRFHIDYSYFLNAFLTFKENGLTPFAEDAFGVQFCVDTNNLVSVFYPESAEIEQLNVSKDEFLEDIHSNPDETLSLGIFNEACLKLGRLKIDEHFAMKVELSLGGEFSVNNMFIMKSIDHMNSLYKISEQIKNDQIGTVYTPN